MRVLLLAVLLVLTKAHSTYMQSESVFSYKENSNGSISFRWILSDIAILCEGAATCINMPSIQTNMQVVHITIVQCSPVILRCVDKIVHPPLLVHVYLFELTEPITSGDVKEFSNVITLHISLKRTDTSIPTAAFNSLVTLRNLHIFGGNMQNLNQNKIEHKYLTTLSLGANNISTFPKNFFDGIPSLSSLQITDNSIENIGAGTLKGLGNLEKLFLTNVGLKSIENGTFTVTPRLSKLEITDNLLQELPNHLLVDLKSLAELSMFNTQNTDGRTEQVKFKLGSHAVSQLPALKLVHLSNLNINTLPENVFDGSNNIRSLTIKNNLINTLPSKIFSKMHLLNLLDLSSNIIHEIPNNIFNNLPSLEMLYLAENRIQHLSNDIFISMTKLNYLSLCVNSIEVLPNQIFTTLTSLVGLDLCNNSIMTLPGDIFSSLTSLKSLNLSGNNIKRLPNQIFANLNTLHNLNLRNNRIEELTMYQFFGLNNLRELLLGNNKISYIPTLTFADLSSVLRREDEAILSILETETNVPSYRFVSPFTLLSHLKVLDLSGNHIANLYRGWDYDLRNIKVLNLSKNYFTDTQISSVDLTSLNITIDMRDNNISKIILLPQFLPYNHSEPASSTLILNNPITCDCNSYGLFLRASGARLDTEPQYILNDSRCIAPPHLKGKLLMNVSPMDLVCDLPQYCPNNCSHCILNVATKEVVLKCLELPSRLPDLTARRLEFNLLGKPTLTLNLIHPPNNIENLDIYKLNLSNTGMNSINFKPCKSLRILDVSHNNLVTVPNTFFITNITLYLSENPLNCDCSLTEKLEKYRVADFELVTCADKRKLAEINVQDLCNRKYALAGYICSGIMCALFILKCIFTTRKEIKKKFNNISRKFLRRGSDYSIQLEKRLDNAKKFDLFISFAHEDTQFVKDKLLPKLENELKQKVCVHYRDWVAGELIADQIVQSVESARRTVIILTDNFLSSEWSFLEFRTAHNMTIQEGRPRVIMILLKEDIVNSERLTRDIKSYIALNTYLLWENPEFWPKLKDVLPRKGQ